MIRGLTEIQEKRVDTEGKGWNVMGDTNSKKEVVKEYGIITVGSFLVAVAVSMFMVPGNLVMGSVSGLALVLIHFIPIRMSVMNLILNIFFLILGFIFIGKDFGAKTVYAAVISPVFIYILEGIFPNLTSLTQDTWLDLLCCILIVSVGQTILFNANASSGGLDIPAKIMNKYFHVDLGKGVTFFGLLTVVSSILVYDTRTLIVGILGTYLNGVVVDEFISGFSRKKRVCILSDYHEEIERFIMQDINRGLTLYKAAGGYERKERPEIVTILATNEYGKLLSYIREVDPNAFVTVTSVSEIMGIWNSRGRVRRL